MFKKIITFTNLLSRRTVVWLWRLAIAATVVGIIGFVTLTLVFHYWIMPNIGNYRQNIEQQLSERLGLKITLNKIQADWNDLKPRLILQDVALYDHKNQLALSLSEVDATLSWSSLFVIEPRFYALEFANPDLTIRRDKDGKFFVAGIAIDPSSNENRFSKWLFEQTEIVIRDGHITWVDELRNVPDLNLSNVNFHLRNNWGHHRFSLTAYPPRIFASKLDLRGDLKGSVESFDNLNGQLYIELPFADLAIWRTWVNYPIELTEGNGNLLLWIRFTQSRLNEIIADIGLNHVKLRVNSALPVLNLTKWAGRLTVKRQGNRYEFTGEDVHFITTDGIAILSTNFSTTFIRQNNKINHGDIKISALNFPALQQLSAYFPLEENLRQRLALLNPRGVAYNVKFSWEGNIVKPDKYNLKARFKNLGMNHLNKIPGFSGLSGHIDASEKEGLLHLDSRQAELIFPLVFENPILKFTTLSGQALWIHKPNHIEIKMNNVAFANADLAGFAAGVYHSLDNSPGFIDLNARFTRAVGNKVPLYLPLVLNLPTRQWLERALVGGYTNDTQLRLKGNLKEFPFIGNKTGLFRIIVKAINAEVDYAQGWPKIQGIQGDLLFEGNRMEITASQATIFATNLSKVRVRIPELKTQHKVIEVEGEATGNTSDFLKFVKQSPLKNKISDLVEDLHIQGLGKLNLTLRLPLTRLHQSQIIGHYRFNNNQLSTENHFPVLEKINGDLSFTEVGIYSKKIEGKMLDSRVMLAIGTDSNGTTIIKANGKLDMNALRKVSSHPITQRLSGTTPWNATVSINKKIAYALIESTMQGIKSDLPDPLTKAAAQIVPLRLEKTAYSKSAREEATEEYLNQLSLNYGKTVSVKIQELFEDGNRFYRGAISFNRPAALPKEKGIVVNGILQNLNLDQWRKLVSTKEVGKIKLDSIDVRVNAVDLYGKRINSVQLNGKAQEDGSWQAMIQSRELGGNLSWSSQDKGRLHARLDYLTLPKITSDGPLLSEEVQSLPGIDVVAEKFTLAGKELGKFEFIATNQRRDWRIEKISLENPEGRIVANGVWQKWTEEPATSLNIRVDVSDAGKLMERMQYSPTVKNTSAIIEGKLSWHGSPLAMDYASLSGAFVLQAKKGQFVKLDPGIGKLLGLLSLQALPRRITLDFKDVLSEGFAFDTIDGHIEINNGVLNSKDLIIEGPSARIAISGETDLVRETQKLSVKIIPTLGEGISLAGILLGQPILGLAAFVAQKIFKNPIDQLLTYEYIITGTWTDPKVEKVKKESEDNFRNWAD